MEREKMKSWENERWKEFLGADSVETPGADIGTLKVPSWYEEKKFIRAQKLLRDNFTAILFASICGLLLSFYHTKITKTLMFTGRSSTKNSLFCRYVSTVLHIQKWFEGNVWDVKDSAHQSLSTVRSMHARVGKRMAVLNDDIVYVSQWDMAVEQWVFVGPAVLYPSLVGLHGWTKDDHDAVFHFWRIIGYLLGIEDKYNICQGSYDQVVTVSEKLLREDYKTMVEKADPISVDMAQNVTEALSLLGPYYRWPVLATYIYELVDLPCPVHMGILDNICYYLIRLILTYLIKFERVRVFVNKFTYSKISAAEKEALQLMRK